MESLPKEIYLDHAATTAVRPEVLATMLPYFSETYGNSSSFHQQGKKSLIALDQARKTVATALNCSSREVIFTNSATQANNLAIFGMAQNGQHIITSKIEHPSISNPCKELEKQGYTITWLDVDQQGYIDLKQLEASISKETALVSIIYANNEIGSIQDLSAISKICQAQKVPLHIDACQAANTEDLDVIKLGVDMMTINSSKIYGPKGAAALYLKTGLRLSPHFFGGSQEKGFNPGTENVPAIVGFAKALELAQAEKEQEKERLTKLSYELFNHLASELPGISLNGPQIGSRLANNLNLQIPDINGLELLLRLDEKKIYLSTGSACNQGKGSPSPTLTAIGLKKGQMVRSIRISLGHGNTTNEIKVAAQTIIEIALKKQKSQLKSL